MRSRTKKAMVAMALAVAGLGMSAGTAVAGTEASWYSRYGSWNDPEDKGGISLYEGRYKPVSGGKTEYVLGRFKAYGETLTIMDYHDNNRRAIVKLWVGGSGPAVFYGDGDRTERAVPLSYDEGQTVYLQVCTSDSPNAECSPKEAKGRT
ncbi:hypothetical protein ACXIZN_04885 [Amycolatopsis sp. TRM77291]